MFIFFIFIVIQSHLLIPFQIILAEKLKYAIYFCKSIDTDEYARVALAEQTDQTASENHSDIGSEVSEDL